MPQEKLKTMLTQNFGGQTRCIMGDVEVANVQFQFFLKRNIGLHAVQFQFGRCCRQQFWQAKFCPY